MVRAHHDVGRYPERSPHPRGDGPSVEIRGLSARSFSPPAWGWSANGKQGAWNADVLPTRVGMVRLRFQPPAPAHRSPHPRGDGPDCCLIRGFAFRFSPPAWGWSACADISRLCPGVLPTRVGMVRSGTIIGQIRARSPHPRGDGPPNQLPIQPAPQFSPPAWGWSGATCARPMP